MADEEKLRVAIYADVASPATKEVGNVLGRTVRTVLAPLRAVMWSFERVEGWIEAEVGRRLSGVPPERIKPPAPEIVVPALMAVSYTQSEDLRALFANLIARSVDSATSPDVHPSFVEVIKQLTPDEARILAVLKTEGGVFFYDVFRIEPGIKGTTAEASGVTDLFDRAKCQDRERVDVAVSNLQRQELAIFEATGAAVFQASNLPEILLPHEKVLRAKNVIPQVSARIFRLTAYGRSFCTCCIADSVPSEAEK